MARNTFIIDEQTSAVVAPSLAAPIRPVVLVPFFSKKGYGEDNQLRFLKPGDLSKYGGIDYDHYGPHSILIQKVMESGATVLAQRLVNDGDLSANIICNVNHDDTVLTDFNYDLSLASGAGVADYSALVAATDGELDVSTSAKVYPLFGLMYRAKGTGGNDFSIRLIPNVDMTEYIGAQAYTLEIYDEGVKLYELTGTFTRQTFGESPLYFPDVIKSETEEFLMYVPEMTEMEAAVTSYIEEDWKYADIITGSNDKMVINAGTDFSAISGISLANGSVTGNIDGIKKITDNTVQTEMDTALISFYSGTTNPELFNRLKYQIDLVIDPGYSVDVNKAIINTFLVNQNSVQFFANMPKAINYAAAIASAVSTYSDVSGNTAVHMMGSYFSYFSPYTSRFTEEPATLFATDKIINSFVEGIPFAGIENIKVVGYEKLLPSVFSKTEIDEFIKYRVNMFAETGIGVARPESEMTYRLNVIGPLSYSSNRVILNDMMKTADKMAERNLFSSNFDYNKYAQDLKNLYQLNYKSKLAYVEVVAKRKGGNGLDQNNTAVTITVQFAGSTDGFEHTFVINKLEQ